MQRPKDIKPEHVQRLSKVKELFNASSGSAWARIIAEMATAQGVNLSRYMAAKYMRILDVESCQQPDILLKKAMLIYAFESQGKPEGVMFHSDHGSNCTNSPSRIYIHNLIKVIPDLLTFKRFMQVQNLSQTQTLHCEYIYMSTKYKNATASINEDCQYTGEKL